MIADKTRNYAVMATDRLKRGMQRISFRGYTKTANP